MTSREKTLLSRPRLLNLLHRLRLARPLSQTIEPELAALGRHAAGQQRALEIGTFQGVSAARIASAMATDGALYCVDPWPDTNGRADPCWLIAQRHLRRTNTLGKIKVVRGFSGNVQHLIPGGLDFAFIDGVHSWKGLETDWAIVLTRMRTGGIVCLHDTVVPAAEPERTGESVRYYDEVISRDPTFELVETIHTLSVLRKL